MIRAAVRDDGDDGDAGGSADRPAAETTAVDEDDDEGRPTSTTRRAAPAQELVAAALRLSDLPDGWAEASETSGIELCPQSDPLRAVPPASSHDVAFTGGTSGPFVASTLAQFADEARAERFMDATADALEDCSEYDLDGATYRLERVTVRGLGDESLAARVEGEAGLGEVGGPIFYVRDGRRVVVVAALSIGGTASDALARDAVEAVLSRL